MAPLSRPLRLQIAALSSLCAIGANILKISRVWVDVALNQYIGSRPGLQRFVTAFQFKAAFKTYHSVFRFIKLCQQRELRLMRLEEVSLEVAYHLKRVGLDGMLIAPGLQRYMDIPDRASAALDEIGTCLRGLDELIEVHPTAPIPRIFLPDLNNDGQQIK